MNEVGGAVERVDDPLVLARGRSPLSLLESPVRRIGTRAPEPRRSAASVCAIDFDLQSRWELWFQPDEMSSMTPG